MLSLWEDVFHVWTPKNFLFLKELSLFERTFSFLFTGSHPHIRTWVSEKENRHTAFEHSKPGFPFSILFCYLSCCHKEGVELLHLYHFYSQVRTPYSHLRLIKRKLSTLLLSIRNLGHPFSIVLLSYCRLPTSFLFTGSHPPYSHLLGPPFPCFVIDKTELLRLDIIFIHRFAPIFAPASPKKKIACPLLL